ncbi:hypothetical protein D6V26_08945 [Vibrio cholerae]|nr:hypothetical protein [Vibrio cholerae]
MINQKPENQKANLTDLVKALTDKIDAVNQQVDALEELVRNTLDILVSGTEVKLTYPTEHTDIKISKS